MHTAALINLLEASPALTVLHVATSLFKLNGDVGGRVGSGELLPMLASLVHHNLEPGDMQILANLAKQRQIVSQSSGGAISALKEVVLANSGISVELTASLTRLTAGDLNFRFIAGGVEV